MNVLDECVYECVQYKKKNKQHASKPLKKGPLLVLIKIMFWCANASANIGLKILLTLKY